MATTVNRKDEGRTPDQLDVRFLNTPFPPAHFLTTDTTSMSNYQPTHSKDTPHASLHSAEPLFTKMLQEIQEDTSDMPNTLNSEIGDVGLGFSVSAFEDGSIYGCVSGSRAVRDDHGLSDDGLERLERRGWMLPESSDNGETPAQNWEGITSDADRRHLAKEMISVATDIYGISDRQEIRFRVGGPTRPAK